MFKDIDKKISLIETRQIYLDRIGIMVNLYNKSNYNKDIIMSIIKTLGRISLLIKEELK